MQLIRLFFAVLFAMLGLLAGPTYAVPPDLSTLTTAISLDTIGIALLAVAGAIVVFKVLKQGAMIVLRFLGWAK